MDAILSPHPSTPPAVPLRLRASVARTPNGELTLRYVLEASAAEIRVPAAAAKPGQKHLLWQHTCFEAFVTLAPGGPYHELNLSPSGEWAAYHFSAYREGQPLPADALSPEIATTRGAERLELTARVPLASLSPAYVDAPIFLALCGVVEDVNGGISYFALRHVSEKADFHHAEGFTLRLEPPKRVGEGSAA
jgi:hypothetical protein